MSRVRTHFCTLVARGYGAGSLPVRYGMNGTMPATVNSRDGSGETSEALGTTVCPRVAKCSRKRRRISRSEEHTSELQSRQYLVCRLLLEKKKRESVKWNSCTGKET